MCSVEQRHQPEHARSAASLKPTQPPTSESHLHNQGETQHGRPSGGLSLPTGRARLGGMRADPSGLVAVGGCLSLAGLGWPRLSEDRICCSESRCSTHRNVFVVVADAMGAPPVSHKACTLTRQGGSRLRTPATLCLPVSSTEHIQQHSLTKQSVHYAPGSQVRLGTALSRTGKARPRGADIRWGSVSRRQLCPEAGDGTR